MESRRHNAQIRQLVAGSAHALVELAVLVLLLVAFTAALVLGDAVLNASPS